DRRGGDVPDRFGRPDAAESRPAGRGSRADSRPGAHREARRDPRGPRRRRHARLGPRPGRVLAPADRDRLDQRANAPRAGRAGARAAGRRRLALRLTWARGELAFVAFERLRVDLPVKPLVRALRKDAPLPVDLHDLSAYRETLVLGAIPVGVVEDGLGPSRPLAAAAHRAPPSLIPLR